MDFISYLDRHKIIPLLKKWKLIGILLGSIDVLAIAFAFQCAFYINYYTEVPFFFLKSNTLKLFILVLPAWLVILYLIQVAEIPRTKRYRVLFFQYAQSAILIITLLLVFYFVFKLYEISRLFLIEFAILGLFFLFIARSLEYKVFRIYRARGYNYINVVLIADDSSISFIENLISNKEWGYRIIAIFTSSTRIKEKYEKAIILLPDEYLGVLNDLMEVDIIDEVIYFKSKVVPSEVRNHCKILRRTGCSIQSELYRSEQ